MSKSGEILRIGHQNYSFLCSHCGFNFHDINEILAHIDYHFDIVDSKVIHTDDTNNFHETASGEDVDEDRTSSKSDRKLSVEEILNCERIENKIRTEFKTEDNRETKTYGHDESPLDLKVPEEANSVDVSSQSRSNRKSGTTRRNVKEEVEIDNRSCPICEINFDNSNDCKSHLRDVHHISNKVFQCYICGYYCKSCTVLKRHFRTGLHSKVSNCYQCESQPSIRNERDPRPHKCCLCSVWFDNHVQFRKHFKDDHQEDVEKFFTKRTNCSEYSCYICKKDFLHKHYLRNHMIVHNEIKAFVCDVCGKCYRTKAVLKRHLNVHEGKIYTCEECGKQFPYYARLRIHRYSHRTELNYICPVCTKPFKVQKYLARHMKVWILLLISMR